jgi:hypothetical protein
MGYVDLSQQTNSDVSSFDRSESRSIHSNPGPVHPAHFPPCLSLDVPIPRTSWFALYFYLDMAHHKEWFPWFKETVFDRMRNLSTPAEHCNIAWFLIWIPEEITVLSPKKKQNPFSVLSFFIIFQGRFDWFIWFTGISPWQPRARAAILTVALN